MPLCASWRLDRFAGGELHIMAGRSFHVPSWPTCKASVGPSIIRAAVPMRRDARGQVITSQLFVDAGSWALTAVRFLVLIASTILILFISWLLVSFLWSRPDKQAISIKPFVVVDPSGNLKNAETGFAQILSAQIADLQELRILKARALLQQARSGQSLTAQVDASEIGTPKVRRDPPWPTVHASAENKVELKVQGVDVSGLLAWIKSLVVPERSGLAFTVHVAGDGQVAIAGDVSDMGIDSVNTLYLSPTKRSPIDALGDLALRLSQLRLVAEEPQLADMPLDDFRTMLDELAKVVDARIDARPETERRDYYRQLSAYFAGVLDKYGDWLSMMILAAETARRAGDDVAAGTYFHLALDHEKNAKPKDRDASRRALIEASLVAGGSPVAARARGGEAPVPSGEVIIRRMLGNGTGAPEQLRQGFQELYDAKGENGFAAIAGLAGVPGWYVWNHRHNSRSPSTLNLFLAWHRAFLVNFERAARTKVKDFALTCWD
jgi:hypothetical protein